jgi:hypothetical protein
MNTKTWKRALLLVGALALVCVSSAKADSVLQYELSGPGAATVDFTLSQNPSVVSPTFTPFFFSVNTLASVNGGALQSLTVTFYDALAGGGLSADPAGALSLDLFGPSLYSWAPGATSPTLLTGVFDLYNTAFPTGKATLTVTTVPTPEPSSLLLLLFGGIVLVGAGLKKLL